MALTLTNRARHLVIVELNNGESLYLAPGQTSESIDAGKINGNEKILKMQRNSDLSVNEPEESSSAVVAAEAEAAADRAAIKNETDKVRTSARGRPRG